MLDGGCSKIATPLWEATALNSSRPRLWISRLSRTREISAGDRFGVPSMHEGVRNAFGPPGLSLSLEYSLHGGAKVSKLTLPDQHMRKSNSNHASSRMLC